MKKILPALGATVLASAGLLTMMPEAKADSVWQADKLVFKCELRNNQYTTIPQIVRDKVDVKYPVRLLARNVVQEYTPLLVWTATLDSDHPDGAYMPEGRCHSVSARLTNLASAIKVNNLQEFSKAGVVNHERVIFVSQSDHASADEVIFTLKPANRDNSQEILVQFQVGVTGGIGGPDLVMEPKPIYE